MRADAAGQRPGPQIDRHRARGERGQLDRRPQTRFAGANVDPHPRRVVLGGGCVQLILEPARQACAIWLWMRQLDYTGIFGRFCLFSG